MVPGSVVHLALGGLHLNGPRAHVQQQVQASVQELHGEEVHLGVLLAGILAVLGLPMGEEDETVGLGGAEVEGDGAHAFGVPLRQADVGLWRLKGDGVQGGHVLALKVGVTLDLHFGVGDPSQAGQLEPDVIVFVDNLCKTKHWGFICYSWCNTKHRVIICLTFQCCSVV